MKLSEKILFCRRKAMMSQEALAEQVGVSRQAVSKWETGEAAPEIGKLLLLAQAFGVTTDWLLSEEEPVEASQEPEATPEPAPVMQPVATHTWVDSVPGVLGTLLRKYGWLFGVRLAVAGAVFLAFGIFSGLVSNAFMGGVSNMSNGFFSDMGGPSSSIQWFDGNGNMINGADTIFGNHADVLTGISSSSFGNPFSQIESTGRSVFGLFSGFVMLLGGAMLVAGIILAVELKKLNRT